MKKYAFLFTIASSITCVHDTTSHIEAKIALISQAKQDILLELRDTLVLGKKAKFAMKKALGQDYPDLKISIKSTIDQIIHSEEFINALDEVIDHQINCICEQEIAFKNITYEHSDALIRKIDTELNTAFPKFNKQINTFFNIFYVTIANSCGCQQLLDRLEKESRKLKKALSQLNIQNQISDN